MMAKLYWRVKLNEKWTWRPVRVDEKYTEFWKIMDTLGLTLFDIQTEWMEEEE